MKRLLLPLLALGAAALAYDLPLRDGTALQDVRLRDKSDTGIMVMHKDGISFVDYSRIPVPDLYTWGFDEAKYRAAQAAATSHPLPAPEPKPVQPEPSYRPARLYQPTAPPATSTPAARSLTTEVSRASGGQCAATTKKGFRCSRKAQAGRSYCYQHP